MTWVKTIRRGESRVYQLDNWHIPGFETSGLSICQDTFWRVGKDRGEQNGKIAVWRASFDRFQTLVYPRNGRGNEQANFVSLTLHTAAALKLPDWRFWQSVGDKGNNRKCIRCFDLSFETTLFLSRWFPCLFQVFNFRFHGFHWRIVLVVLCCSLVS